MVKTLINEDKKTFVYHNIKTESNITTCSAFLVSTDAKDRYSVTSLHILYFTHALSTSPRIFHLKHNENNSSDTVTNPVRILFKFKISSPRNPILASFDENVEIIIFYRCTMKRRTKGNFPDSD